MTWIKLGWACWGLTVLGGVLAMAHFVAWIDTQNAAGNLSLWVLGLSLAGVWLGWTGVMLRWALWLEDMGRKHE